MNFDLDGMWTNSGIMSLIGPIFKNVALFAKTALRLSDPYPQYIHIGWFII